MASSEKPAMEYSGTTQRMALPERYKTLLQSALAFSSAASVAEALEILSGVLRQTINFDAVALVLSRGGHAWYSLSRHTDHPQFSAQPSEIDRLAQPGVQSA